MLHIVNVANESPVEDLKRMQRQLMTAKKAVTGDGMEGIMNLGLIQLHRFVLANIEVDTARTKHSIFMQMDRKGKDVEGRLGSQVFYSPWVRDAGHGVHFFEYAQAQEGPAVLAMLGREFTLAVNRAFD